MSATFEFSLVIPERQLLSRDAEFVVAPGAEGYFGVLSGHAPMVTLIRAGGLSLGEIKPEWYAVSSGYAEVMPDRVTILVERAMAKKNIDMEVVEAEKLEAESQLSQLKSDDPARPFWEKQRDYADACYQVFIK